MGNWFYDEMKHCGVDYSDDKQAQNYDWLHLQFRDYKKEFEGMLDFLSLSANEETRQMSLIDLGCGTGASTVYASKHFKKVFAVDVSEVMITEAKHKSEAANLKNVEFHTGGFLTYNHSAQPVDLLVAKHSFHHIPDFWKQIALYRMNKMIKTGGVLYLCDVVFNVTADNYKTKINDFVAGFKKAAGDAFGAEVETHIRDEFSTFGWILEGMIEIAGFKVEKKRLSEDSFVSELLCRKEREIAFEQ
ncbi:class I SAM-dependent methyltransferase [Chitinispirillales bacterium ANBcel5]|uniref:class I SAM-dependent methyltransferase n=1 Tax=Cellulosispirillum alkaliphilum TaxID=3039283 RepID=UPI002A5415B3|nr:class I SAM-dependent methyltransferase [Chitinispirillales bacterium ANBcel5]